MLGVARLSPCLWSATTRARVACGCWWHGTMLVTAAALAIHASAAPVGNHDGLARVPGGHRRRGRRRWRAACVAAKLGGPGGARAARESGVSAATATSKRGARHPWRVRRGWPGGREGAGHRCLHWWRRRLQRQVNGGAGQQTAWGPPARGSMARATGRAEGVSAFTDCGGGGTSRLQQVNGAWCSGRR